jgi:hypothetical protein
MKNPSIAPIIGMIAGEPTISTADAKAILQYILNLSPSRPIYKSWDAAHKKEMNLSKLDQDTINSIFLNLKYLVTSHGFNDAELTKIVGAINASPAYSNSMVAITSPYQVKKENISAGKRK